MTNAQPGKEDSMDLEHLVAVETFSDKSFAEAAVSLLASEDIEAAISSDDAGHEFPNLDFAAGVRVLVAPADVQRAREILNAAADED